MGKFAILIPSYNRESTIAETLESVQRLREVDYSGLRIIVCDDCSTDRTIEVARNSWWRNDVDLEIQMQDHNYGEYENTNRSIGRLPPEIDWLFILHSDDIVDPLWYVTITQVIGKSPSSVATVCTGWNTLMPDGSVGQGQGHDGMDVVEVKGTIESIRSTLVNGCWWHLSGCAIKFSAYRSIGGLATNLAQLGDWEWLLRALRKGWSVNFIPQPLMTYRVHERSVSADNFNTDRDVKDRLMVLEKYCHTLNVSTRAHLYLREAVTILKRRVKRALKFTNEKMPPSDVKLSDVMRSWHSKRQA